MQNSLGITLKSSVIFNVKVVVKGFENYYRKNSEICSIYKAQCAKENNQLKFTEQFCKMLIA